MARNEWGIGQLLEAVEKYELKSGLSAEDFEAYSACEAALEAELFHLATAFARSFDFEQARAALEEVIATNKSLQSRVQRELGRIADEDTGEEEEYRARLTDANDAASGLILLVQGQIFQNRADEYLMANDLRLAIESMDVARQCFEELADEPVPQADFGAPAAALTVTRMEFFEASIALQRGKYSTANDGFRSVSAKYSVLLEQVAEALEDSDERARRLLDQFQHEFTDQMTYTQVMLTYSDFFCQVQYGHFEYAVQYAGNAVSLYERWLQSAISNELPVLLRNIRKMELEYFRGWHAWAKAEYAVENRQWDECMRHVQAARQNWIRSTDMALQHAFRGLMSPQYETANTEMLLQSTLRRRLSEKRLYEQITELQEKQRHSTVIHAQGGHYMSTESSSFQFDGPVNAGVIGNKAKAKIDRVGGDQIMTTTTDLRELAIELVRLRDVLAAGAKGEQEKTALEHVEQAETEARKGNEEGVRKHLAAAGKWVLSVAEKIMLPVATEALKASIGV